jgi:hypothetical protein
MARLPENIRRAVDMLGSLQQNADSLKTLARNNKQASNNLATQVQAVLERVRQLGVSRDRMARELQQEIEALLQTATQRQVEHLQNLRDILESAVTHQDIQSIANQLQEALGGQPEQGPPPPPEGGVELQEMRPRVGGKKRNTYKKGGYPRSHTKGEFEVGRSRNSISRRKRKTVTRR